jgi:hypothetical protein
MSNKLRYGPRFKPTIASANAPYDESIDRMARKDRGKMAAIFKSLPKYKKELFVEAGRTANKKKGTRLNAACVDREQAEIRMAQALRKAVEMLEFNMTAMMQYTAPKLNYNKSVNQLNILNAIADMKTKCGVWFESDEFKQHVSIDDTSRIEKAIDKTIEQTRIDANFRDLTLKVQRDKRLRAAAAADEAERLRRRKIALAILEQRKKA